MAEERKREVVEYYAEESFAGANLVKQVHLGWGVALGCTAIML